MAQSSGDRGVDEIRLGPDELLGCRTLVHRWTYHVVRGSVAILGVRPLRVVRAGQSVASTAGDLVVVEDAEVLAVPRRLDTGAAGRQDLPAAAATRWATKPACCVDALRPLVLGIR